MSTPLRSRQHPSHPSPLISPSFNRDDVAPFQTPPTRHLNAFGNAVGSLGGASGSGGMHPSSTVYHVPHMMNTSGGPKGSSGSLHCSGGFSSPRMLGGSVSINR